MVLLEEAIDNTGIAVKPWCLPRDHLRETEAAQDSHTFLKVNFPLCS